ncbi:hypothetical protein [Azonexus sp.]|uniref:hypothetical protein n=1 Tax=Azonexus sp. TaxID=1872668 RepID=UPI0035B4D9FC
MFERPHHRRIAQILLALDAQHLRDRHCLFGGGTAMAMNQPKAVVWQRIRGLGQRSERR